MGEPVSRPILRRLLGPLTWRNVLAWAGVILLVLTIRWLLFEPYTIPSGSMEPTLHGDERWLRGDRVGVNKWIYGPRIPFSRARLIRLNEPQRWDIVVFKSVDPNAEHPTVVKRLVGLPGEYVQIKDGRIWTRRSQEEPWAAQEPPPELKGVLKYTTFLGQTPQDIQRFAMEMAIRGWRDPELNPTNDGVQKLYRQLDAIKEKLNGADPGTLEPARAADLFKILDPLSQNILTRLHGRKIDEKYPLRYGILEDEAFSHVPPDHYLVCGDNSLDSADGRYFGWLPNGNIMGRVFCIWWPLNRTRDFTGFSRTWWGMGLLYGGPALLVGWEIYARVRRRTKKNQLAA